VNAANKKRVDAPHQTCLGSVRCRITAIGLCLCLLGGCGYQFRVEGPGPTIGGTAAPASSVPPPRVAIRTLRNATFEPNLETRFTNYLRHEFSSGSGAEVVPEGEPADLVLSGDILAVILPTISFTQARTLESRAEVVVVVRVEETRTKRLVIGRSSRPDDSSRRISRPVFSCSWSQADCRSRSSIRFPVRRHRTELVCLDRLRSRN
jgi:hypothetical protein